MSATDEDYKRVAIREMKRDIRDIDSLLETMNVSLNSNKNAIVTFQLLVYHVSAISAERERVARETGERIDDFLGVTIDLISKYIVWPIAFFVLLRSVFFFF